GARVELTGSSLVGKKEANTDNAGYYRFANLPPGTYTLTITAKGFTTVKREGITIEVGHLPTIDFKLEVGTSSTVVEVTAAAPEIDVTTTRTMTNITEQQIDSVPHGTSFQSVIQFAPSARNEPLAGSTGNEMNSSGGNGTGGQSPGSGGNGQGFGYSVAGGADSENSYLVEGQETADSIGGFSHTNVPFDFIQEVQVKSSGIEAEHGGSLGGVVNVIMKKGSNNWHGSLDTQLQFGGWNGSPTAFDRYDPVFTPSIIGSVTPFYQDAFYQEYQPKKDKFSDIFPGATVGGAILKDKVWFFAGFNPDWTDRERTIIQTDGSPFSPSRNQQTYYTYGRLDVAVTQKIRAFGSWLYQYQRVQGEDLPFQDDVFGQLNTSASIPSYAFSHALGYAAPNLTTNVGADFTLTQRLVATVRWGYAFQNYHDFGFPTTGNINFYETSGIGSFENCAIVAPATSCTPTVPIASTSPLYQNQGYFNIANNINTTTYDATHRNQVDADLAWFKSGWWGTHNIKGGYQLTRTSNSIFQHFNAPNVNVYAGSNNFYTPQGPYGQANCAQFTNPVTDGGAGYAGCAGLYGYASIQDYGSYGQATSNNNALFIQDAWTVGRGVTINAGIRVEKEYLPAEDQPQGGISKPINFGWGDKIAPRVGAAWDVFRDGRMKIFGAYGVFNDTMKLNLAISSFGGLFWQNCYYAMNTDQIQTLDPIFGAADRYCNGPNGGSQALFPGGVGVTPPGFVFLENQNFRTFPTSCSTCTATEEGVAPGLKPYRQHEDVLGVDYQLRRNLALEVRWDRRRLDHVIEDSAIFNPDIGETFVVVNPGQGVNKTFDGFWNFLYGTPSGCGVPGNAAGPCPPNNIPSARSYDGMEVRLTKVASAHWYGMFSYTYSHFRGNYTGLTSTDIGDGGGGRNAPNNSRAFDEPFFSWGANGQSSSGDLPTDRPNALKGYAYYELGHRKFVSDIGLFQFAYSGTPQTTIADVGYSFAPPAGAFPTYLGGRGKWINVTQDQSSGVITAGNPQVYRSPWYTETDFQLQESYKVAESKVLSYAITIPNLLNQRATTAYYPFLESQYYPQFMTPGGQTLYQANSVPAYYAFETGYDYKALLNSMGGQTASGTATINSQYGKPYLEQIARTIRMQVKFTF
ncbi:MAG: carboxypeptidase regulatory-like domain-containing protein, partial [Terriglobales bacterium]